MMNEQEMKILEDVSKLRTEAGRLQTILTEAQMIAMMSGIDLNVPPESIASLRGILENSELFEQMRGLCGDLRETINSAMVKLKDKAQ